MSGDRRPLLDESLDEAIDRVARDLTAVPHDAARLARIHARLEAGARARWPRSRALWTGGMERPALVAVAAVAVVIAATLVPWREAPAGLDIVGSRAHEAELAARDGSTRPDVATGRPRHIDAAAVTAADDVVAPAARVFAARTRRVVDVAVAEHDSDVIPALGVPATAAPLTLNVEPLVLSPVGIEGLAVGDLQISDLNETGGAGPED